MPRPRRLTSALAADLAEGEVLTYASATAFRTLFAFIPAVLFVVALLGFLDLTPVWTVDLASNMRPTIGEPAFALVDGTVRQILATRQVFWLTVGLLLAVWQISSTVRVIADALNRIHGLEDERTMRQWLGTSIAVSVAVGLCLLVAAVSIYFGSQLAEWLFGPSLLASIAGLLVRGAIAVAAMLLAVALLLRYMPAER